MLKESLRENIVAVFNMKEIGTFFFNKAPQRNAKLKRHFEEAIRRWPGA